MTAPIRPLEASDARDTLDVILSALLMSVPVPEFPTPTSRSDCRMLLVHLQSTQRSEMTHAMETVHASKQLVLLPQTLSLGRAVSGAQCLPSYWSEC